MHNWIDLTLAILMIVSIVSGIKLGFTRTAIGLLSSILALVFGLHYYRAVAVSLRPHITQTAVADRGWLHDRVCRNHDAGRGCERDPGASSFIRLTWSVWIGPWAARSAWCAAFCSARS